MKKILLVALIFILTPIAAFAQSNLVNLPIGDTNSFNDYINAVYAMFISIAAMIAVVKIIIAGVKYMFTDIVPQKTEAKKDIQAALLGLVVVLAAVLILTVINPDLTNFNLDVGQLDKREQNSIQNEKVTASYEELCSTYSCESTSDNIATINVFSMPKSDVRAFGDLIRTCNGTVRVLSEDLENVIAECYSLNDDEKNRITNIYTENGGKQENVNNILKVYQRRIAPFLIDRPLENGQLFIVGGDFEVSYAKTICSNLGGDVTSWFNFLPGAELICEK